MAVCKPRVGLEGLGPGEMRSAWDERAKLEQGSVPITVLTCEIFWRSLVSKTGSSVVYQ